MISEKQAKPLFLIFSAKKQPNIVKIPKNMQKSSQIL
jgi:hypothetical protein